MIAVKSPSGAAVFPSVKVATTAALRGMPAVAVSVRPVPLTLASAMVMVFTSCTKAPSLSVIAAMMVYVPASA